MGSHGAARGRGGRAGGRGKHHTNRLRRHPHAHGALLLQVEVPLGRVDWARVPAVEVDALGEPLFEFPPVRPAAGRVFLPPGSPNVRNTIWQLDPAAPAELRLVEYGFAAEWEETAARVRFGAQLLPAVATACVPGATQLALVTADGALHLVAAPALLQDQRAKGQRPSMPALLGEEGGVRSAALGALFARAGAPTATLLVAGHACVGTDQGSVLCVPVEALDEGAAFELKAGGSGLSKVWGGGGDRGWGVRVFRCATPCMCYAPLWCLLTAAPCCLPSTRSRRSACPACPLHASPYLPPARPGLGVLRAGVWRLLWPGGRPGRGAAGVAGV